MTKITIPRLTKQNSPRPSPRRNRHKQPAACWNISRQIVLFVCLFVYFFCFFCCNKSSLDYDSTFHRSILSLLSLLLLQGSLVSLVKPNFLPEKFSCISWLTYFVVVTSCGAYPHPQPCLLVWFYFSLCHAPNSIESTQLCLLKS